ncbi:MAG: hypothetical protein KAR20_06160 [Candidatus Heimdallarchaeota archaeon]|nr:hypothetical protein [Candidatus Heimdallarchaeota archaeon]
MKKGDHLIEITKTDDGTWWCTLYLIKDDEGKVREAKIHVNEQSFPDLLTEIGNRKWIDLINKNDKK